MAAQEPSKEKQLCPQCFAMIADAETECQEMVCPLKGERVGESAEHAVYPDLAKANLMRMRGEYKPAKDLCLSVLKRHPGNVTAHTLLGDVCAEEGDLAHSAEWYEMALDLEPSSDAIKFKLDAVRQRKREREAATTAEQLGLPTTPSKAKQWVILSIAAMLGVGLLAYYLGELLRGRQTSPNVEITTPITVPPTTKPKTDEGTPGTTTGSDSTPASSEPPTGEAPADPLLARIQSQCMHGSRVKSVSEDPGTKNLTLTMTCSASEDFRLMAAQIGVSALRTMTVQEVLVHVMEGSKDLFFGEIKMSSLENLKDANGQSRDPATEDLASLFSYEWPHHSQQDAAKTDSSGN